MATIRCEFCHQELDTRSLSVYRKVLGWVPKRKQGLALASEPLGWAHGACIDREKLRGPISWSEESLF